MTPEGLPKKRGLLKLKQNPGESLLGVLEFAEGGSYRVVGSIVSLGKYPTVYLDALGNDTTFHMQGILRGPCLLGQVEMSTSGRPVDRAPYGRWNACPTEICVIPEPPKPIPPSPGLQGTWEMALQPRYADCSISTHLSLSHDGDEISSGDSLWGVLYFKQAKFLVYGILRIAKTPRRTSVIALFLTEHSGPPYFGHIEIDLDSLTIVSGKYRGIGNPRLLEVAGEDGEIVSGRKLPSRPTPPPSPVPEPPNPAELIGCWDLELLRGIPSSEDTFRGQLKLAVDGDSIMGRFGVPGYLVPVAGEILDSGPENSRLLHIMSMDGETLKMVIYVDMQVMEVYGGKYATFGDSTLTEFIGSQGQVISGEKNNDCTHQAPMK